MEINSVTEKYYQDYQIYLRKMRDLNLDQKRIEHEQHLQRLRVDSTQRARELNRDLGQKVDTYA